MLSFVVTTYHNHKKTILALLIASAFSVLTAYATPPGSPYTGGQTLDPSCAPGDTNCTVLIIPDQTGNNGKYLTTDGTTLSWATVSGGSNLIGSTSELGTETWLGNAGTGGSSVDTVYIGTDAGGNATNATNAVFIGGGAGYLATNAQVSNFIGNQAGLGATNAEYSNFFGQQAGKNATNAKYSIFIGGFSGYTAPNATYSVFIGENAGLNTATDSVYSSGFPPTYFRSVFIGENAGANATDATKSVFIGSISGYGATNAADSVFIGEGSGVAASNASASVAIGKSAGFNASNADRATFIGFFSGSGAAFATNSTMLGFNSGNGATNAANSIFIGYEAGEGDTVDNTGGSSSILIGNDTSTGGFVDSIALGTGATNTASNQLMIGNGGVPIDATVFTGTGGTECTITTGTGIACTSDERLKTDVSDLTDTLDTLRSLRTVTYEWSQNTKVGTQVGFIAQDMRQHFPLLVSQASNGYLQVNYAGMAPILTKAIQELDVQVQDIASLNTEGSFAGVLRNWLGDVGNRITRIFTGEICLTDPDGSSECLTKAQLVELKQLLQTQSAAPVQPVQTTVEADAPTEPPTDTQTPQEQEVSQDPEPPAGETL